MTRRGRQHGTDRCYCGGCRRQECRAAHTAYRRDRTEAERRRIIQERPPRIVAALEIVLAEEPLDEVERRGLTLALERHRRLLGAGAREQGEQQHNYRLVPDRRPTKETT